jgi:ubiquinone/menaquinone biosynthesis C-methylase UbiE
VSNSEGPHLSWWKRVVVPRAVHQVLDTPAVFATRTEVLADVSGSVVELGFGSGLSLTCYPTGVTEVLAVDPDDTGWRMSQSARDRAAQHGLAVQRLGRDAQQLPLDDESADTVVTLWTLCTVPDMTAALSEIERVLRPGGRFVFAEHGRLPDQGDVVSSP